MNTSSTASAESLDMGRDETWKRDESWQSRKGCGARKGKHKWSGVELGVIIGGFVLFWPVGLVALGIKLMKGELWAGSTQSVSPWTAWKNWKENNPGNTYPFADSFQSKPWRTATSSGNAAFDAYKREQLDRLEAERRKLEDEQRAFAEYLTKLREAKDKDEFDRFMGERNAPKPE
jgi:hypothetical protein